MRKFKVECDLGDFVDENGIHWIEVEAENEDEAIEKAQSQFRCEVDIREVIELYETPLNNKYVCFDSADGFTYAVPVIKIAENRARYYAHEFDGDERQSMIEDTLPLFQSNEREIFEWAKGNMNWDTVFDYVLVLEEKNKPKPDYQDEWVNNKFTIK